MTDPASFVAAVYPNQRSFRQPPRGLTPGKDTSILHGVPCRAAADGRTSVNDPYKRCDELLPGVSRTFALLIPELPEDLRKPVCCAYLLCRIADTVEDVTGVTLDNRLQAFEALQAALAASPHSEPVGRFTRLTAAWQLDADHRSLLTETATVFAAYDQLPPADRVIIADCANEMIDGMRETVLADSHREDASLVHEVADLERYCYYVAGVVGRMLTRLYWRNVYGEAGTPPDDLVKEGIEFGLGLQLTNILKDYRADLSRGVSYMPDALAAALHVNTERASADTLPAAMREWLVVHTSQWLDTAFRYTLRWPPAATGIRVFCLGALFMAVRTLVVVLTHSERLDATEAPKITRQDVTEIMGRSRTCAGDDEALKRWYDEERDRLTQLLTLYH